MARSDTMRVLQVVKGLRKTSGVATFVRELSDALYGNGINVSIGMCHPETDNWLPPSGKEPIVALADALNENWDVVHVHGLWDREIRIAAKAAVAKGISLVWSPHGMLAPWALKYRWWKKCLPWHLYVKRQLHHATVFHVTSEAEAKWVKTTGFDNDMAIVPLGTHLPDLPPAMTKRTASRIRRLLFVGRIHPVKGLENLVRAWAMCVTPGWQLRIVGPDSGGYESRLKDVAAKLGCTESVVFPGSKLGAELIREYLDCDCLVLPSFSENFGGVVIDAMAAGKPVITSKATPWSELEGDDDHVSNGVGDRHRCGWWIDNDPTSLSSAISAMMALPDEERHAMGARGRTLVQAKYTWKAVAEQMVSVYNSKANKRP